MTDINFDNTTPLHPTQKQKYEVDKLISTS